MLIIKNYVSRISIILLLLVFASNVGWAEENQDYIIGPSDVLKITVWDTPSLDLQVPVRPDGKISYPLIGDILVDGLTSDQIREILTQKLSGFIHEPRVSVLVLAINSFSVYIHGAIGQPGEFKLDKKTNILQLICRTGGVAGDADLRRAYLLRQNKRLDVDFYKLLENGDLSQNIELMPRDLIFIPHKKIIEEIVILGEVNAPQVIPYIEDMRILNVIFRVGGFTKNADRDDIKIIRQNPKDEIIKIDAAAILDKGNLEQNIKLMPADIIIVGEKWL